VDPIRKDDLETMRRTSPEEKARQAIELFDLGVRLKRAALKTRNPQATEHEIEQGVRAWLAGGDD